MTWAKIDTALHRNPKVRMAGRDAREVFIFILLANAEQKAGGKLPDYYADPEYLSDSLQCSVDEARNGMKRCETFHLLQVKDGVLTIVGWEPLWGMGSSTDRVRKHRERKKAEALATGNVTETLQQQGETEKHLDKKRVEEKRVERPAKASPRKRASQLPANWTPTDKHQTLARELRLNLEAEAEKFRDHAEANGRTQKDWDAAFRLWLKRSAEYQTSRSDSKPYQPTLEVL